MVSVVGYILLESLRNSPNMKWIKYNNSNFSHLNSDLTFWNSISQSSNKCGGSLVVVVVVVVVVVM